MFSFSTIVYGLYVAIILFTKQYLMIDMLFLVRITTMKYEPSRVLHILRLINNS